MGSVLQTKLPEIAFKFIVQFISNGIKLKIEALTHIDNNNNNKYPVLYGIAVMSLKPVI